MCKRYHFKFATQLSRLLLHSDLFVSSAIQTFCFCRHHHGRVSNPLFLRSVRSRDHPSFALDRLTFDLGLSSSLKFRQCLLRSVQTLTLTLPSLIVQDHQGDPLHELWPASTRSKSHLAGLCTQGIKAHT